MNYAIAASLVALTFFAPAPQASTQGRAVSVASDPAVRDALARLDVWLEGQRHRFDLPGFSVGVVHDQQLLWSKGYGYADVAQRIPSTEQTLYRIASISKTFAATAVVQLAERGKLALDDPVSRHLTWFAPRDGTPGSPVRVWNLLSHSGGLQRESPGSDWDALVSPDARSIANATKDTPLVLPPQTRLAYSNYGYTVAGQLVQQVSGQPYAKYLSDNALQPLVSSVSDLAKWASFQFRDSDANTGPVLTGASLRNMHRPHFLLPDWSQGWGLGWRLTRNDAGARIDHGGSLPGCKSSLPLDPEAADIEVGAAMLRPTGPASFVTDSPPGSITRAVASRVQFTLDESGQAVSFTMDDGAHRYRRVR